MHTAVVQKSYIHSAGSARKKGSQRLIAAAAYELAQEAGSTIFFPITSEGQKAGDGLSQTWLLSPDGQASADVSWSRQPLTRHPHSRVLCATGPPPCSRNIRCETAFDDPMIGARAAADEAPPLAGLVGDGGATLHQSRPRCERLQHLI